MQPQEKLYKYGIEALNIQELIALILRTGRKGRGVMQIAKDLANTFGRGEGIVTSEMLAQIKGIGDAKASALLATLELGKRLYGHKKTQLILQPEDVWKDMREEARKKKEFFVLFFLDMRSQVIRKETISIGTLSTSIVHPREVFEMAITHHAGQIILSHNHPSGEVKPSEEDIETTKRLIKAGEILGIQILDHVIVTADAYLSMKEKGIV